MTVTSAPWTSSAADQFDSANSYAQSNVQTSHDASHAHSFANILNEAKKQKADSPRPNSTHSKIHKTDESPKAKDSLVSTTPAKPVTKPPITGQFGLQRKENVPEELSKADIDAKNALLNDPAVPNDPAVNGALLNSTLTQLQTDGSPGKINGALAGADPNQDSGSLLMAKLLQAKSAGVSAPEPPDSDTEILKAERSPDLSPTAQGLASPVAAPITAPAINPVPNGNEKPAGTAVASTKSSVEPTPQDSDASEPAVSAMPGHLAFALRLNANLNTPTVQTFGGALTAAASTQSPATISSEVSVSAAPINMAALAAESDKKKDHSGSDAKDGSSAPALIDSSASSSNSFADSTVPQTEAPVAAQAPELDERFQNFSNEPVRNVLMQVVGEDNRRVDIRLLDRAGELRVSVKSGDSILNQTLQNQMPELTSRLESARYQAEVWMPSATGTNQPPAERDNGNADGQQKGRQQDRPDWVDDLEGATPRTTERIN